MDHVRDGSKRIETNRIESHRSEARKMKVSKYHHSPIQNEKVRGGDALTLDTLWTTRVDHYCQQQIRDRKTLWCYPPPSFFSALSQQSVFRSG